jgi:hypothetical protein
LRYKAEDRCNSHFRYSRDYRHKRHDLPPVEATIVLPHRSGQGIAGQVGQPLQTAKFATRICNRAKQAFCGEFRELASLIHFRQPANLITASTRQSFNTHQLRQEKGLPKPIYRYCRQGLRRRT